jgi:hypothetical protein
MKTVQIRDTILDSVERYKPSQDTDLSWDQILFYMNVGRAELMRREWLLGSLNQNDPSWFRVYPCMPIQLEQPACPSGCPSTNYMIELPFVPFSPAPGVTAIARVYSGDSKVWRRISPGEMDIVMHNPYRRPGAKGNPMYSVIGRDMFLYPEAGMDPRNCPINIVAIGDDSSPGCSCCANDGDEFGLPDYLVGELVDMCLKRILTSYKLPLDDLADGKETN